MVVELVGCNNSDVVTDDSANMQSVTDYEITQTNYGFAAGDPVFFIIGYQYTTNTQLMIPNFYMAISWN